MTRTTNNRGITTERAQRIVEVHGVRFRVDVEEPVVEGEEEGELAVD